MRRHEPLSPEVVRELEAIDRSLAGETVDYDLREIDDLVRDVRASAPQMRPELSARLEREIEQGFEEEASPAKPKFKLPSLRILVPAMGTLAAVLLALVFVNGQGDSSSSDSAARTMAVEKAAPATDEDEAASLAAPATSAPTRDSSGSSASTAQRRSSNAAPSADVAGSPVARKVERRVTLVLEQPENKVEETADDVIRTVDRFRGIVASSSISADDSSGSEAVFDLRIPTNKLDAALAELSKLGHVAERQQDLQDITAAFTSTRERLEDHRAERKGLLRALGNASSQSQIDSLRSRLRIVNGQISAAKAQLSTIQRRASLSTVSVTVRGDGKTETGGGGWSVGDAFGDAVRALEVIAGVALIAIAIALPLGLLGGAIRFGSNRARSRRRENALDAA